MLRDVANHVDPYSLTHFYLQHHLTSTRTIYASQTSRKFIYTDVCLAVQTQDLDRQEWVLIEDVAKLEQYCKDYS